jgi:hypothetical protein
VSERVPPRRYDLDDDFYYDELVGHRRTSAESHLDTRNTSDNDNNGGLIASAIMILGLRSIDCAASAALPRSRSLLSLYQAVARAPRIP